MKIQDIIFILAFLTLFVLRKEKLFLYAGLTCFLLAIPLFAKWVFFTAERMTWYGSAFILVFLMVQMFLSSKEVYCRRHKTMSNEQEAMSRKQ